MGNTGKILIVVGILGTLGAGYYFLVYKKKPVVGLYKEVMKRPLIKKTFAKQAVV